ncbi:hypothetical protein [Paramicrobacterium agarici]|uniref:hypothetical protein n=1 Tax=Paramicrobacterium agarici TaxID=630514 RepID=UPI00114E316A|nr:hypothetical protein [Microbacterium agarici]TQO24283.1 hypothetical protein FB385_3163 [Microbacterium agarici]
MFTSYSREGFIAQRPRCGAVAVVAFALLTLAGCGSNSEAQSAEAKDASSIVKGRITSNIAGHYGRPGVTDPRCDELANRDLSGKRVSISDASGTTVGLADLKDEGPNNLTFDGNDLTMGYQTIDEGICVWSFTIEDFTSDSKYFTITVEGIAGNVDATREELLDGVEMSVPAGPK